jgi:hypothetical protein
LQGSVLAADAGINTPGRADVATPCVHSITALKHGSPADCGF